MEKQSKKVKPEEVDALRKAYIKLYKEWSELNHRLLKIEYDEKLGLNNLNQLKASVTEKIYNTWNNGKGQLKEEYQHKFNLQ